jgi:hypothetical protein
MPEQRTTPTSPVTCLCDRIRSHKDLTYDQLCVKVAEVVNKKVSTFTFPRAMIEADVRLIFTGKSSIVGQYKNGEFIPYQGALSDFLNINGEIMVRLQNIQYIRS